MLKPRPSFKRPRPVPQRPVDLPSLELVPNDVVNEEISESEHMPFNQAILESEFQSAKEIPQENTGYDYQEPPEQHIPFIPWTGQDFMSEQNIPAPLEYEGMTKMDHMRGNIPAPLENEGMTKMYYMHFIPAIHESEYQTFGEMSPENIGYDYQEQPPQQQHIPFTPDQYLSQPLGIEAEGNITPNVRSIIMCPLDISGGGGVCGEGQGACCAGSNEGCPAYAPVCSEWGYCQENRNIVI